MESQELDEVMEQYSDENDKQIDKEEEKIEIIQRKPYKGNFASLKEESLSCPYASCGRKFVSSEQLKFHIERRHAPSVATSARS